MFGVGTTGNSGWQIMGTWTPSNATVNAVSVTPNAGSGTSQTFQFLASDSGGAADLVAVEGWFTPNGTGAANTCLIYYAPYTQRLYLATDDASGWTSQMIGTAGTLQNSQCTLSVGGTTATPSGNNLTLSVPVTFKAGFTGAKQVWMYATGTTGNSGWQDKGSWTVQ